MQTRQKNRTSQVRTTAPKGAYTSYRNNMNDRTTLIVLGALCLLVPPVGILLVWRAQNLDIPTRAILSAAGFAATTLIFFLLMRPDAAVSTIAPTPATPQMVGYGAAATEIPAPVEVPVVAPAPGTVPAAPSAPETPDTAIQETDELTDSTIVYAVTNNASSYHLSQICDGQENHRSLPLRDALSEGLAPCEKCVGAKG